ncbi:DUF2911 domain-containing protein [Rubrolithibacter danxiaensis]|uniref:DUF2911 domain-containing protein n=1 Tax=Rubrolithibacter danxiaensis TaxID=3390805 RepID=UPI003BF8473D
MKKLFLLLLLSAFVFQVNIYAQDQNDKSKRPSPPAKVSQTLSSGLVVTIDYSQPSVKGRTVGKDIAPYGKVWRTGANEATVFEISKDASLNGKALKAGKYSLYTIPGENSWVVILNKAWKQWGTVYNESEDALRFTVKPTKAPSFTEKMTFTISKTGVVSLMWGNSQINFTVK